MIFVFAAYGAGLSATFIGVLLAKLNSGGKIRWSFVVAAMLVSLMWFVTVPSSIYAAWRERRG